MANDKTHELIQNFYYEIEQMEDEITSPQSLDYREILMSYVVKSNKLMNDYANFYNLLIDDSYTDKSDYHLECISSTYNIYLGIKQAHKFFIKSDCSSITLPKDIIDEEMYIQNNLTFNPTEHAKNICLKLDEEFQIKQESIVEVLPVEELVIDTVPPQYTFSINRTVKNKIDDYSKLTKYFINQTGTLDDLKECIKQGFPFAPELKLDVRRPDTQFCYRNTEHFQTQQIFALDFDDSNLQEFIQSKEAKLFNFVYTTHSHQQEGKGDRFRAVMVIDTKITNFDNARNLILYLLRKYPLADQAMKDPTRGIYSSDRTQIFEIGNIIKKQEVVEMLADEKLYQQKMDQKRVLELEAKAKFCKEKYGDKKSNVMDTINKAFSNMPIEVNIEYSEYVKFIAGLVGGLKEEGQDTYMAVSYISMIWKGEDLQSTTRKLNSFNGMIGFGTFCKIAKEHGWL